MTAGAHSLPKLKTQVTRRCLRTCCWCCRLAPYRCRLATASTSTVKCIAVRRKLFKRPRPVTAAVPLPPQPKQPSASPAAQPFSSWSPILRRRDASSWAAEHGEGRRELQVESPGRSKGWSIGSQHIFSDRVFSLLVSRIYDPPSLLSSNLNCVCVPPFLSLSLSLSLLYYSLQCHMVWGLHHLLPKERCNG